MSEQAMLPQVEQSDVQMSALDLARLAHQKYIVKQQADDLERAIGYYIEAIRNDSAKAEPYYRLASLMYEKGQISLDGAIEQCRTAVTLEPDNINAHIYAGYFLSMSEDYKSAQKEFNIAIKTGKFNTARPRLFLSKLIKREIWLEGLTLGRLAKYFYYLLSGSALLMCDIGAIRLALETISDNVSVFSYKTLGETFEKAKMFSTAQKAYTMGVAQTEHGDVFYKKLGDLSMSRQDLLSGLECYKKVLRVTPDNREVLIKLATLIQTSFPDRIDEAIDYYNRLLEFNIDNDKIYYELGHLYLRKDDKLNAVSAFKLALNYNDKNPYYNNSLAYAYVRAELYDDAIEYYQRAIKLNPDAKWTSIVCHALGAVYGEVKGNFEAAEATYQAGLVLDSTNYELLMSLGDLLMVKGDIDRAIRTYCDGITLDPENFMAYAKAGLALWEKDYVEEAIISFHKSINLNPNFEISQNNLGVVYLDGMGTPKEAVEYFVNAIKLNPNYTLAYFNAGRAYQALGENTKAAEYYQMAMDLNKITNELSEEDIKSRLYDLFN
ncbi:tetratricopeptide repeat protein [bacterium]|nr:tetratricopeptide repeat protein [bacterium]